MKNTFLRLAFLALVFLSSCSDSTSDEFNNINPEAVARYIETIAMVSAQDAQENTTITVNYDGNNRVTNVTDGTETGLLVYENDDLSNVSGQGESFDIEELYQSPYDAFEVGEVLEYDNSGNPVRIKFLEYAYDWETNTEVTLDYTAIVTYDSRPNPYFYTLQAAGVIEVLDGVDLNFGMAPNAAEIVQARMLFPLNNITRIQYNDENGDPVYDVSIDYVYNSDNYPTTATVTGTSYDEDFEGNPTTTEEFYSLTYTYRSEN